jgi:hypothetical protein
MNNGAQHPKLQRNMKKENRGGKRENSGRPEGDPTKVVSFRIKLPHVEPVKKLVKDYLKEIT